MPLAAYVCPEPKLFIFGRALPAAHPTPRSSLAVRVWVKVQRGIFTAPVPERLCAGVAPVLEEGVLFLSRVFTRAASPLYEKKLAGRVAEDVDDALDFPFFSVSP